MGNLDRMGTFQRQRSSSEGRLSRSRHLTRVMVALLLGVALLIPLWVTAHPSVGTFKGLGPSATIEGEDPWDDYEGGAMRFLPKGGSEELATFCVDINHFVSPGNEYEYLGDMSEYEPWKEKYWKLVYLMHHYPPDLEGDPDEMASRQAAVWHFSDGFTPTVGLSTTVGGRAWVIIAAVNAAAGSKADYETIAYPHLTLDPPSAEQELTASAFQTYTLTLMQGTTHVTQTEVTVATNSGILDLDGTRTVTSTTSFTVTTDDAGQATFRLWAPAGPAPVTATLTATAEGMTYPAGVVYINMDRSPGQKLILGEETQQDLSTEAEILWKERTTAVTLSAVSGQSNGWTWLGGVGAMLLSAVAWVVERRPRRD